VVERYTGADARAVTGMQDVLEEIRSIRTRDQSRLRRLMIDHGKDLKEAESREIPRVSRVFTQGATAGWKQLAGPGEIFRLVSYDGGGRGVYCVFDSIGSVQGTGPDTPEALLLKERTPYSGPFLSVWAYMAAASTLRVEYGAHFLVGGPSLVEVVSAEETPVGTVATVTLADTAGGTTIFAANLRRIYAEITNMDAANPAWLAWGQATPVAARGIYLPAGRTRWWTGTVCKGTLRGIMTAALTAVCPTEEVVT